MTVTTEHDAKSAKRVRRVPLTDVLEAVWGTELDTPPNIRKLARLEPDVQRKVAGHLREGNAIAARVTLTTTSAPVSSTPYGHTSMTKQVRREMQRLTKGWDEASEEAQIRFLRRLAKRGVKLSEIG
jgi:hypothetical protein